MKINDAAKILNLSGKIDTTMTKKAYRNACAKFHPDRNPAGAEMMKAVNAAYDAIKDFSGNIDQGHEGYADELNDIINAVIDLQMPGVELEVCGAWLWVTGKTKPFAKKLGRKEGGVGLSFANKKKAWYYRPADWKSVGRGNLSLDEIREAHGSRKVNTYRKGRNKLVAA